MEPMTIREIMDADGGKLLGEFGDINRMVGRVETDSRTIHAGSLFVPLVGERFDGHAYINAALEGGAAGCFTQRERESYLPGKFYIKVDSTQRALRDLAKYYKKKFPIPVVALTGSVGKTTTKDMVAAVLGEKYRVLKTEGNLNNEIGVPMTLLRLSGEHEIAVLELGMNHAGEIDYLSALVEPDVVLMTNIGDSHIEHFGSREKILEAKSEIFHHVKSGAFVVINGDDPLLNTLPGKLPYAFTRVGAGEGLEGTMKETSADDLAVQLVYAEKVIFVPGFGLAQAQAQRELADLGTLLKDHGVEVSYAIHPVAGRMPGHMNVLLAEANVPYEELVDLDDINPQFPQANVALVVGANDVTNPAARKPGTPVSGMPILDVDKAQNVVVMKRGRGTGYAGIQNELYFEDNTQMLFGDAKASLQAVIAAVKELIN